MRRHGDLAAAIDAHKARDVRNTLINSGLFNIAPSSENM